MKYTMVILGLVFVSTSAFATSTTTFDYNALFLVNAVQECSAEYAKAVMNGQIVLRASASQTNDPTGTTESLDLVIGTRNPPPSFVETEVWKLQISKQALKSRQKAAPDKGPVWEKTVCTLVAL